MRELPSCSIICLTICYSWGGRQRQQTRQEGQREGQEEAEGAALLIQATNAFLLEQVNNLSEEANYLTILIQLAYPVYSGISLYFLVPCTLLIL